MRLSSLLGFRRFTAPRGNPQPAPVRLAPLQWEDVEWRISEFISDPTSLYAHSYEIVARENVLPLLFEWTGFLALRSDGQIVLIPYDEEPGEIELVREERLRNSALFQGYKLHPDLPFLLPSKPPDAITCSSCQGTGQLIFPEGHEHLTGKVLCDCGGLGWLPQARGRRKSLFSWFSPDRQKS